MGETRNWSSSSSARLCGLPVLWCIQTALKYLFPKWYWKQGRTAVIRSLCIAELCWKCVWVFKSLFFLSDLEVLCWNSGWRWNVFLFCFHPCLYFRAGLFPHRHKARAVHSFIVLIVWSGMLYIFLIRWKWVSCAHAQSLIACCGAEFGEHFRAKISVQLLFSQYLKKKMWG